MLVIVSAIIISFPITEIKSVRLKPFRFI